MGTSVVESVEQELLQIGPTFNVASISGSIPAQDGLTVVIDWMNAYCVNPTTGGPYGTTILMTAANDLAEIFASAYADGFGTGTGVVRACYQGFMGGCASVRANQTAFSPRKGQAVAIAASVDGAAGADGWFGATVGYHYELL